MKNDDGDMGEPMLTTPAITRQPLPPVVLECQDLREQLRKALDLIWATYGALTPDGCDLPPSGINTMPDKVRALLKASAEMKAHHAEGLELMKGAHAEIEKLTADNAALRERESEANEQYRNLNHAHRQACNEIERYQAAVRELDAFIANNGVPLSDATLAAIAEAKGEAP
jgi:chromosome segregation ATPase